MFFMEFKTSILYSLFNPISQIIIMENRMVNEIIHISHKKELFCELDM